MKRTIFSALLMMILLSSCGKDAASLTVVTGIGVDGAASHFHVTAEAIQLSQSQEDRSEGVLLHAEGGSMTEGIENTVIMTGRPLHCNHTQVILLSRETAENRLQDVLEDILRQNQYPVSVELAVSKESAIQVMETRPVVGSLGSTELLSLIRRGEEACKNPAVTAARLYQEIKAPGIEGILPFIELRQNGEEQAREITGTALFRDMRMISVLDAKDTASLLWMRGNAGGMLAGKEAIYEVIHLTRQLEADAQGARLTLTVTLKADGDDQKKETWMHDGESALKARCESLISGLKEIRCDAIGFGQAYERQHPKQWAQMDRQWAEVFSDYPIEIIVRVKNLVWGRTWSTDPETEEQNAG